MIKVKNKEKAIRIVESFNALSVVLPLYDDEARRLFRASFKVDIVDIIPSFFMELSRICLKDEVTTTKFFNYIELLLDYIKEKRDALPRPVNADDESFRFARAMAERLVNSWRVEV